MGAQFQTLILHSRMLGGTFIECSDALELKDADALVTVPSANLAGGNRLEAGFRGLSGSDSFSNYCSMFWKKKHI